MRFTSKTIADRPTRNVLLTVLAVIIVTVLVSFVICSHSLNTLSHVHYIGLKNVISEKISKTVKGMEMNAMNVFDEVGKHLDSPEAVVAALKSKTYLNPEIRGYFAAFEPEYFPQEGKWFEPYIHHRDSDEFEYTQVGSDRHDYTKSDWYIRAKQLTDSFWSDPYYYYDGTSMSGHYATFVRSVFDSTGRLACVCGADITFDWLAKELQRIDNESKNDSLLNSCHLYGNFDFYSIILDKEGSCIVHPEGKSVSLTKEQIHGLSQTQGGTLDLDINGVPSTVFYEPLDHIDLFMAVVVAKQDVQKPLLVVGFILLLTAVAGMSIVWLACRRWVTGR